MTGPAGWLLGDRARWLKATSCIALAAGLVVWGARRGPEAIGHFSDVCAEPDRYAGAQVSAPHIRAVRGPGGEVRCGPFALAGEGIDDIAGDGAFLSFRGVVEAPDRIRVEALHIHRWEGMRLAVSVLALAAVACFLGREFLRRG
ncbi:MAG: hypothetical protein JXP34_17035 [Planctomycetes bacterium]|nr:hypothetical protein [Planctomycetota bacterium]